MKRSVATVVLALSVGLAACDDRSQAAPEVEASSVPAAEPAREAAPAAAPPGEPSHPEPERNFAVILVTIDRLDWLRLARETHRRAGFTWDGDMVRGTWLVP